MKNLTVILMALFLTVGCTAKHTVKMYEAKQETLRTAKVEQAQANSMAYNACQKDANPGLCVAFTMVASGMNKTDTNQVPHLDNPVADITRTVIQVAGGAYGGYIANKTAESAYSAIVNGVSSVAGQNSSVNVNGNYNSGAISHNTETTNTSDSSVNVGRDLIDGNSGHVGDTVDNSWRDNSYRDNRVDNTNNSDNSDNSDNSEGQLSQDGTNPDSLLTPLPKPPLKPECNPFISPQNPNCGN
jgi:hypothetical protein